MDERRYKLHAYQTVNEFKAYRLNRTEQCRLNMLMDTISRERLVSEKDFKMKASKLLSRRNDIRRTEMQTPTLKSPESFDTRSLSIPRICKPVRERVCKSARSLKRDECIKCDQITGLVLDYDAKSVKIRAQSSTTNPRQRAKEFIDSIETIIPLRRERTDLGLGRENNGLDGLTSDKMVDVRYDDESTDLSFSQRRLVRESSMMVPPDEDGHICSTLTSKVRRRTFPGKIEIQRKIGDFVKCQEEYNRQNPIDDSVVVQNEVVRLQSGSRIDIAPPKFVSKREAMIQEVLEKLGLKKEDIPNADNSMTFSTQNQN